MFSLLQQRENGLCSSTKLYDVAKASKDFVQRLRLERRLEVHRGCVNSICWNENGTRILSGSDDQYLAISDPYTGKMKISIRSGHHSNIFCAKFLPNSQDLEIVSCSGAGSIYYTQVDREDMYGKCLFDCHVGTTYELVVVPNEARTFLTCGEDGTVRWFDLRIKTSCNKERCKDDVLINCRNAVTSISVDPVLPYQLATACADGSVRVFDRRMLGTRLSGSYSNRMMTGLVTRFLAPLENKAHRITSLNYSPFSHDILVSYSAENVYLFNTQIEESKEYSKTGAQADARETVNGEEASGTDAANQPPTKRLRLRGDWSDTGPNARPERERTEDTTSEGQPQVNLMQRMSDMLTRWLDGSLRRRGDDQEGGAGAQAEGGNSEQQAAGSYSTVPEEPENEQETGGEGGEGVSRHLTGESDVGEHRRGDLEPSTEDSDGRGTLEEGSEPECEDSCEAVASETRTEGCFKNVGDLTKAEGLSTVTVQAEGEGEVEQQEAELGSEIVGLETRGNVCAEAGEKAEANEPPKVCDTGRSATSSSSLVLEPSTAVRQTSSMNLSAARTVNSEDSRDSETDRGKKGSANEGPEHAISSIPQHQTLPQSLPQLAGGHTELPKGQQRAAVSRDSNRETGSDDAMGLDSAGATVSEVDGGVGSNVARSQGVGVSPLTSGEGETGTSARLEPVISLHYSEEGTTASTIHVAYTSFDIMDPPHGPTATSTTTTNNTTAVTTVTSHPPSTSTTFGLPPPPSIHQSSASVSDSCGVLPSHPRVQVSSDSTTSMSPLSQSVRESNTDPDNTTTATNLSQTTAAAALSSAEIVTTAATSQGPVLSAPTPSTSAQRGATPRLSGISTSGSRQHRLNYGDMPDAGIHQVELDEFLEETEEDEEEQGAQEQQVGDEPARDGPREELLPGPSSSTNDERNYAALCMQSMYRRRMEEREKQAMASVYQPPPQHIYSGHRNSRTMIKESNFWGEKVVMSGSDCGRIFMWDRDTAQLIMLLEADRHVVNCLQPHPFDPVLASSGIDYDVKIWSPLEAEPCFDSEAAEEVMRRNQIMLEETRDTITVPAAFMLRVLASLNQIRAGRAGSGAGAGAGSRGSRQQEESSPGDSD